MNDDLNIKQVREAKEAIESEIDSCLFGTSHYWEMIRRRNRLNHIIDCLEANVEVNPK